MRVAARALCVVVLVATLVGCGASQEEKYCDRLRDDRARLGELVNAGGPGALITGRSLLKGLADAAPDDLLDEWQTFLAAVDGYADAVEAAGLRPSQLKDGIPGSVSAADKEAIEDAAAGLAADDVVQAAEGIEAQGRDVCKVDLGL